MQSDNENNIDKKKSKLFSVDVDWWMNACLDPFHPDWYAYIEGYRRGAEVLVEHVKESRSDLDTLVFPIVFLCRQYIELRLKYIIWNGKKFLDQAEEFPKHHRLEKLWEEARKILEEVYEGDPKEELDKTEDIIKGFSDRDAFGTAFRYPTDIEDKKSLPNLSHINVRKFFEFVSKVSELLDGASMGIDEYLAWKMDI